MNNYEKFVNYIKSDFCSALLHLKDANESDKNEYIKQFVEKDANNFVKLAENQPELFIKAVANTRNPKLQYEFLNSSKDIQNFLQQYISSLTEEEYLNLLNRYFYYPIVELSDYQKKWIGSNKIHIKSCGDFLGDKYDNAKYILKNNIYSTEIDEKLNGINLDSYYSKDTTQKNENSDKIKNTQSKGNKKFSLDKVKKILKFKK